MTVTEIADPSRDERDAVWVVHVPDTALAPPRRLARVLVLAVGGLVLVSVLAIVTRPDETSSAPVPATSAPTPAVPGAVSAADTDLPSAPGPRAVGIEPSTVPSLVADATPVAGAMSPERATASLTGEVPVLREGFAGGWVAQLSDVPYGAGVMGLEATWHRVGDGVSGVVVTTGEAWSTLTPGRWYLVVPGAFPSSVAADAFCASLDVVEGCAARRLG